jgi:ribonuclease P protein component
VVVYAVTDPPADGPSPDDVRVGLIVGRNVGNAVVRNTVRRRLRHLTAERLGRLPAGTRLVIRATPAAASRSSHVLADALDRAWQPIASPAAQPGELPG